MPASLLFVYGTLKRGGGSHRLIADQTFVAEAVSRPWYRLYDQGRYPCLVEDLDGGTAVRGELWQIDSALWKQLDEYEDAPRLFSRREIALEGNVTAAWAYLYERSVTGMKDCGGSWPAAQS